MEHKGFRIQAAPFKEGGQFQVRGYSAVICGPGNIEQAHQANEFISIEQFKAGEDFIARLIDQLTKE